MALKEKLSSTVTKYKRIWRLLKKPTKEEFWSISKISGIGIGLVGIVGFLVALIMNLIKW
jgi:protein transport protein SEC61 subunit gamma and related proteins